MRSSVVLFATIFWTINFCSAKDISDSIDFKTTEEILAEYRDTNPTNCASEIFSNALNKHSNEISPDAPEYNVRAWAKSTMQSADVLTAVLQCPEIQNVSDETTIIFTPIEFKFSNGRSITINYSTQPKVLKQMLILANKPSLPNGEINPKLMDPNDPAKYINTEPAWYAIMVVQHDSLSEFVVPGKNNTLSVKYINDNIDKIYPHGYYCTSKSAIANDKDTINQVVHEVVNIEDDSNDYYVAGDVDLGWVMYAEIAADIIISVATVGIGEAGMIAAKSSRAFRNGKNLLKNMHKMTKEIPDVKKYADMMRKAERQAKNIEDIEKEIKTLKDADKIADKRKEISEIQKSIVQTEKDASDLVKKNKDVAKYKEMADSYKDLHKYFKDLRAFRRPQTGNVITRTLKTLKAANTGAKTMDKANKVARAGMSLRSARIKDWLFDATLKNGARLARFERDAGLLYSAAAFIGDMYDHTSDTSKEFSNGIEFKPLGLLSADDLKGQENVVNYGMWLMWQGNSTDPADDDAAYLQSMDFAAKFFYALDEYQDKNGANCNVDIYVVRPIIRLDETNFNDPRGEMFYLFMNEIPWTTADQFGEQIKNINDWERAQSNLTQQDPANKYNITQPETPEQIATYENYDLLPIDAAE